MSAFGVQAKAGVSWLPRNFAFWPSRTWVQPDSEAPACY